MKTIVLGLGNPILTDDSVGLKIAQKVRDKINWRDVDVVETTAAGLDFLEILSGYDRAILIDAIQTPDLCPGEISRLSLEDIRVSRHANSPHDVDLVTAVELGRKLHMSVPAEIVIFAVQVEDVTTLSESCTAAVDRSIPVCVDKVIDELGRGEGVRRETRTAYSVLVVDDELIVRESLRDCLVDSGVSVAVAESGEEALKILAIQNFDFMIADYRLPGIDGLALVARVKSLNYPLKSVLITAYPTEALALRAQESGASGFLAKPIDLDKLEDLVERELFGRESRKEILSA